jgi:hypothetical protein
MGEWDEACYNVSQHVKICTLNQKIIKNGYSIFSLWTEAYLVETPKCAFYSKSMTKHLKISSSSWSVIPGIIRYAVWCSSIKVGVYCSSILIHSLNGTLQCIGLVKSIHDSGIQTTIFINIYSDNKVAHVQPLPSSGMWSGQTCPCEPCRYSCCIRPAESRYKKPITCQKTQININQEYAEKRNRDFRFKHFELYCIVVRWNSSVW